MQADLDIHAIEHGIARRTAPPDSVQQFDDIMVFGDFVFLTGGDCLLAEMHYRAFLSREDA